MSLHSWLSSAVWAQPRQEDTWATRVKAPDSVEQACAEAVQAEIENDAIYSRLLEQVTEAQVRLVMLRLQDA